MTIHSFAGTALLCAGAVVAIAGMWKAIAGATRRQPELSRTLSLIQGLRVAILGLCVTGIGAGLYWHVQGLATLSIIIALQELRETSFLIDAVAAQARGAESVRLFGMARVPPPMRLTLPPLVARRTTT